MRIHAPVSDPVTTEGEPIQDVNDLTYLNDGAQKDIKAQINKARGAYRLGSVWKSKRL